MPAERPCVLIVEDDNDIRVLLEELLEDHGCRVVSSKGIDAVTGVDAVQLAAAEQPSLVLLDLRLERLRGEDLFVGLRRRPETNSIPIIVVSAISRAVHIAEELGADGVIQKPFTLQSLLECMQKVLHAYQLPDLKDLRRGPEAPSL